jgi:acyl carrier protein
MSAEEIILSEIKILLKKNGRENHFSKLNSKTNLFSSESGMDSLDLAELIVRMEEKFGVDPFKESGPRTSLRTLGDLAAYYEKSAGSKKTKKKR